MTRCAGCRHRLDDESSCLVVCMHGSLMGDEYVECYYRCPHCGACTMSVVRERFLGDEVVVTEAAVLSEEEAQRRLAVIARCPEPWNKHCRCDAHRDYFGDALD